jgi:polyferredoxin
MMDHAQALGMLEDYFANRLDRAKVRELHQHFNECEDCKLRLRVMKAAGPRPGFTRLGGGAAQEPDRLERQLYRNRVMTYAVVAALFAFLFFFRLKGL